MGKTATMADLTMVIADRQRIAFNDYKPRGIPGFDSDIAEVVGFSSNQTDRLLDLVDQLDHHYDVERRTVRPASPGSKKVYPEMIRVTVSQA